MSFEIVKIVMNEQPAEFKFGMLAMKKVSEEFGFANVEANPIGFLFEFSYHAFNAATKKQRLLKKTKVEFEEEFDTIEFEDVQKLSEGMYKAMQDMGKIIAPAQAGEMDQIQMSKDEESTEQKEVAQHK